MIELVGGLVWRRGAFLHGPEDVAALNVTACEGNLRGRNIGLHVDDHELSGIRVHGAHGLQELVLPLEPFRVHGIRYWPNGIEAVPDAHALIGAFVDVNEITVGKNVLDKGLLSGNQTRLILHSVAGEKAGTVGRREIRRGLGTDRLRGRDDLAGRIALRRSASGRQENTETHRCCVCAHHHRTPSTHARKGRAGTCTFEANKCIRPRQQNGWGRFTL